ncbi:MAG: hypothetical protein WCB09_13125 [Methylocella sp.]
MFRRRATIPRKGQGLAFQASKEGLMGTREVIVAGQITDAMRVTGTPKMAIAARMRMDRCPERSSHLGE